MEINQKSYTLCIDTAGEATGKEYLVLAYYRFAPVADPHQEVLDHKTFLGPLDCKCRVYISEEGINGQLSIHRNHATLYMEWLAARAPFEGIEFKVHYNYENVYPRQTIKYRKQLVAFDQAVDVSQHGERISPAEWKKLLESSEEKIIIDTRNDYEWAIGHFEGAELPACGQFREFPKYTQELKERIDPKTTPVMMCCTGGIRCELYSAYLKQEGFEKVYQLEGGIIKYGLEEKGEHWKGKLFVFDDRMAIPMHPEGAEGTMISKCIKCGAPEDTYYNCANVECNRLFICCRQCADKFSGCCSCQCTQFPRIRHYDRSQPYKPMRRWHHYSQDEAAVSESNSSAH